ncbi:helix-turn-helix domain-containing protein [Ideonella sp.]|uniref:helix-turn-helix domain-containing protein n=1 Tax=Ideonella sp. TaxID=1929293 RepID=UPI003BB537CB
MSLPVPASADLPQRAASAGRQPFHELLKAWRSTRRFSQLELAGRAAISQRHLSFLETGRSRPSREMVMRLAQVLAVPLRERNELLRAGGYAPLYTESSLDQASMAGIRMALETTLRHHDPFPALVVNRQWDLLFQNAAVDRLIGLLGEPSQVWNAVDPSGRRNVMRLMLHPEGLQPLVADWPETAGSVLSRLEAESQANPANAGLQALLADLRGMPGVADALVAAAQAGQTMEVPVLTLKLRAGSSTLMFFSMICTFGKALDLTADELRLELLFPSDEFTTAFLRQGHPPLAG